MSLQFFNTFSRSIEVFEPREPGIVRLYTCGPTVYNHAHIGNFRAYIFEDLLQRHLEFRGFRVQRVMNLTDVDDKTIRGCRAAGVPLREFTAPFVKAFHEDLGTLGIKPAAHYPAATEDVHIARMITMISKLTESGHAYLAEDGSVYFRINHFAAYGKLAHLNLDELRPSGRIRNDDYEKENIGDFALWKAWDAEDGDVGWESPWGRGRPGWHIECSAMAGGLLGDEIDIHCGAVDNIFPHHEAEIAQSEAYSGKQFVRYWLHCAHLIVEGRKMSKSLGNFFTLRDLLAKGWTGRELRYALLTVHYQLPLNYTFDGMAAARAALERIDAWRERLQELAASAGGAVEKPDSTECAAFGEALDDNLNISQAMGQLFELLRKTNRAMDEANLTPAAAAGLLAWWQEIDQILNLTPGETPLPQALADLLKAREIARTTKQWAESDRLRGEIEAAGWLVKDTREGQKVTPVGR